MSSEAAETVAIKVLRHAKLTVVGPPLDVLVLQEAEDRAGAMTVIMLNGRIGMVMPEYLK